MLPFRLLMCSLPHVSGELLRLMTWNLEVFNLRNEEPVHASNPNGPRTDEQLNLLKDRILSFNASVIAVQEMNDFGSLIDLRQKMNGGATGPWRVMPEGLWTSLSKAADAHVYPQQNALLYDQTKVRLISSGSLPHVKFTPSAGLYPTDEIWYRQPVTGVFEQRQGGLRFRVIGVHCSWQQEEYRRLQGEWLGAYISDLLRTPTETRHILLTGDMNGPPTEGRAPHDGITASGELSYLPKSNGASTAIGGAQIDHFYATADALSQLHAPSSTVVRNDDYGETAEAFRACCSDHFLVYTDLLAAPPESAADPSDPEPSSGVAEPSPPTAFGKRAVTTAVMALAAKALSGRSADAPGAPPYLPPGAPPFQPPLG